MSGESLLIKDVVGEPDRLAVQVAQNWSNWDAGRSIWKQRKAEVEQSIYATASTDISTGSNSWNHNTHRPKITQIYDNLLANYMSALLPNNRWLTIESEDINSDTLNKKKAILGYLSTKHRISKLPKVVRDLVSDYISVGNCFAMVFYVRETSTDQEGVEQLTYAGPRVRRISPLDIVFNPTASAFERSPKIVRTVQTLGELAREIEDNPDSGYKQDVLELISQRRMQLSIYQNEDIDKAISMQIAGFGSYAQYMESGYVEILDLYGDIYDWDSSTNTGTLLKNQVITVVDRQHVIRQRSLDTWSGAPLIHHTGWRTRPDSLWAMGPLDNLVGLQYRINHLENARADAFDAMLSPDLVLSKDVEIEDGENGAKNYYIPENGLVQNLAPDTTVLNADLQIADLENKMELYAGAPREQAGFRTPGEKTKFEVSALQNAGSRIFQQKLNLFETEMLEPIVNSEIEVARRHLGVDEVIRFDTEDDSRTEFLTISREDLTINGSVVPIGARHFARQNQLATDLRDFTTQVLADEELKQHVPSEKLVKVWEELLGFDKFDLIEPYGRIPERLKAQRLAQAADSAAQDEAGIEDDEDPFETGIVS